MACYINFNIYTSFINPYSFRRRRFQFESENHCTKRFSGRCICHHAKQLGFSDNRCKNPQEYQSGHLKGATNLDYYSNGFLDSLKPLDKNSTYIVYCRRGIRGGAALEMMKAIGFKRVYNILGGLTLWAQEGMPMIGKVI